MLLSKAAYKWDGIQSQCTDKQLRAVKMLNCEDKSAGQVACITLIASLLSYYFHFSYWINCRSFKGHWSATSNFHKFYWVNLSIFTKLYIECTVYLLQINQNYLVLSSYIAYNTHCLFLNLNVKWNYISKISNTIQTGPFFFVLNDAKITGLITIFLHIMLHHSTLH